MSRDKPQKIRDGNNANKCFQGLSEETLLKLYAGLLCINQQTILQKEKFHWEKQARAEQWLPKGNWHLWLILAGRGFGKTRTGAETIRYLIDKQEIKQIGLVGATDYDARQIMVEGQSGLLSCYPDGEQPLYEPSKRQITWPNGAKAFLFSADAPEQLRGPQFDFVWVDELCKFDRAEAIWDQINFSLRLGAHPRALITTTPKPMSLLKSFVKQEGREVFVTRGSTFDNKDHLSKRFLQSIEEKYKGTTLGRQELFGEIVDRGQNGLWSFDLIEKSKSLNTKVPELKDVIIAVDPAVTSHSQSDETGIIVLGRDHKGYVFVVDDLSGAFSANQWMSLVKTAYHKYKANLVIMEGNQGGDILKTLLTNTDPTLRIKMVHAIKNKFLRAEPVHALYEQGKIFHIPSGRLKLLENQMLSFSKDMIQKRNQSPDRVDALVWGITELCLSRQNLCASHIVHGF